MGRIDGQEERLGTARWSLEGAWQLASSRWRDQRRDELGSRHIEPLTRQASITHAALAKLNESLTKALSSLRALE